MVKLTGLEGTGLTWRAGNMACRESSRITPPTLRIGHPLVYSASSPSH